MWSKCADGKSFMVCGGVARDAEYSQVGEKNSSLTKFSVKNDEKVLEDGTTEAKWTSCECWHSVARYAKNIKKGDTVLAIGMIKTDTWTDKQTGEPRQAKKLVCDFVAILPYTPNPSVVVPPDSGSAPSASSAQQGESSIDDYPF